MTFSFQPYRAFAAAVICAGVCIAAPLPSAPLAGATGGAGGSGGGTLTGPGGTSIGSVSGQIAGTETVPGGTPGIPSCVAGGCSGSLAVGTTTVAGPGAPVLGVPGLQATPTLNLPPNPISCITAQCHGNGGLSVSGGVSTPVVGATGGLTGGLHG